MSSCVAMAIELKTEIAGPRNREIVDRPEFLSHAREVGERIRSHLEKTQSEHPEIIGDVRGLGPMDVVAETVRTVAA
jgi:4-aminobutyrate aminotransferase-like enzyme